MGDYLENVSFTFTGDIVVPSVITAVSAYFVYRYVDQYLITQTGVYSIAPCVTAWSNWAKQYVSLFTGGTVANVPASYIANDVTLIAALQAYPQCNPNSTNPKWTPLQTPDWFSSILAESTSKPSSGVTCYGKTPPSYHKGPKPCTMMNYNQMGVAGVDPCFSMSLGDLTNPIPGTVPNGICVATDLTQGNDNNTVDYANMMQVADLNTTGVCQYSDQVIQASVAMGTIVGVTSATNFQNYIQGANPYAAIGWSSNQGPWFDTYKGANNDWYPYMDHATMTQASTAVPTWVQGMDNYAGAVLGNYMNGKVGSKTSFAGLGPKGPRDTFCFTNNNCSSGVCNVQTLNPSNASTGDYADTMPLIRPVTFDTVYGSTNYYMGPNLPEGSTLAGVCD